MRSNREKSNIAQQIILYFQGTNNIFVECKFHFRFGKNNNGLPKICSICITNFYLYCTSNIYCKQFLLLVITLITLHLKTFPS